MDTSIYKGLFAKFGNLGIVLQNILTGIVIPIIILGVSVWVVRGIIKAVGDLSSGEPERRANAKSHVMWLVASVIFLVIGPLIFMWLLQTSLSTAKVEQKPKQYEASALVWLMQNHLLDFHKLNLVDLTKINLI